MKFMRMIVSAVMAMVLTAIEVPRLASALDTTPPSSPVRLVFIHHSTGGYWLADPNENGPYGELGIALRDNNYYVSATNYEWGYEGIGSRTDIPNWPEWFTGTNSSTILNAVYDETGQNVHTHGDWRFFGYWSRLSANPGGENEIIMFKSCFPNSNLYGDPNASPLPSPDEQYTVENNTVANAKAVYNNLLTYFSTRQDKLFVVITAPPLMESAYSPDYQTPAQRAANARAFNNWLVNDWRDGYAHNNVAVFDYFNVLSHPDNHHHIVSGAIVHYTSPLSGNYASYPSDDSHPNSTGQQKATAEFVPLLNAFYNTWKGTSPSISKPTVSTDAASNVTSAGATLNGTVNPNGAATTYYFEYGLTTDYVTSTAAVSAGSGTAAVSVNADISGLSAGMTYHFRLAATNSEGTATGSDQTFTTQSDSAADSVTLSVQERGSVDRVNEYVSFGVPLPRGWNVLNVSGLRLRDAGGTPVPAQFEILSRWGGAPASGSAPAKWVLVGFFTSVSANSSKTFQLDNNGPGASSSARIQVDTATSGKMVINTGTAQFEMNTTGDFNLFNQVTISGQQMLQSLISTNAIDYSPAGSLSIVSGGNPDFTPRITSAVPERSGDLNTIIKIAGSILDDSSRALLDFTARLHFYAGTSDVRVDFTVENNQPVIEGEGGQPANVHSQGAVNSVYIGSLKLALQVKNTGGSLRVLTEQNTDVISPVSQVRIYQDSSGTDYWDVYLGEIGWPDLEKISAEPRLQSYCSKKGYDITGPGVAKTGNQAIGWMSAFRSADTGITVAVRDFWQNFPKAIETGTDGKISVDLFPNGSQFKHNFRVGEEKTHSIFFHFGTNITAAEGERIAKAFNKPLFGTASASWYIDSGALGEVPAKNLSQWPLYERYVNVAFEPNPDFDSGDTGIENTTLLKTVEKYNFYGWQDYGDVPLDYEAFGPNQAGQMNLKYWYVYGMLVQFCRSADLRWIDMAVPSAWHLADIDYLHIPDEGIQHWSHGAYFGHSQHDEPGCANPNRNYNSPSVDLFFGVPELILAYKMTGEQRFLDTAMEGLQAMENEAQFSNFEYPVFYRERANLIFAFTEGYRQTGDVRWLNNAKSIIGPTARTSDKGWLNNPETYIPPEGGTGGDERISGFAVAQTIWTMGRYLDFCNEYGMTDDLGVKNALQVYSDFIISYMTHDIPTWYRENCNEGCPDEEVLQRYTGHIATIDSIWFTADYETYLEINDWALVMADVLTYAYKYSGQQRFLDTAGKLYTTGTLDQVWLDDSPVYMASKDLVNSLNWGLVYMNATKQGASDATGDVDGDGDVDLKDLIMVLKILSGHTVIDVNLKADVNGDDSIGFEEGIYILQKMAVLRQ